jgi:translocation and assembly module TamB
VRYLRYSAWVVGALALAVALVSGLLWFWILHTTSGARWILGQTESAFGLEAQVIEGSISGGLRVDGLSFTNESVNLSVGRLTATLGIDLFPASVDVSSADLRDVDVTFIKAGSTESGAVDVRNVLQNLVLPIPVRVSDLRSSDILITTDYAVEQIDSLSLAASWFENVTVDRLDISSPKWAAGISASIDLQGNNAFSAIVDAQLKPALTDLTDELAIQAGINGDPDGLDVRSTIGSFATVEGSVGWQDQLEVVADIILESFDLTAIVETWPAGFPVSGTVNIAANEATVTVSDSTLSITGTDARVFIDALVDRERSVVEGQLRWESLRWPLPAHEVRVHSKTGDIRVSGSIDEWKVDGSIAVGTEEMPDGTFVVDVAGTRETVAGRIVEGRVFGGNAAGEVTYSWSGEQPWAANLDIVDINLGSILPELPGRVSGRIDGQGSMQPFVLHATLENIDGSIRGVELQASGAVDMAGGVFEARGLRIEHGKSWLILDGSPTLEAGLGFEARIADANIYVDDVAGELHAKGHARVTETEAAIKLALQSPEFIVRESKFADVSLVAEGTHEQQSMHLSGVSLDTPLKLGVTGAFDDWRNPLDSVWRGNIESFSLDLGDHHAMVLGAASQLEFSTKHAELTKFCVGDQTGSLLCANGAWNKNGDYSVDVQMTTVSASIVEHVIDAGLLFDQLVSGTLRWQHSHALGTSGRGKLSVSPGTIRAVGDDKNFLATGHGIVDFDVENGTLLSGVVELPLPGTGGLAGNFSMLDVTAGADSGVKGNVDVVVTDLRRLTRLVPLVDSVSGSLHATIELSGTPGDPVLAGDLTIKDGGLRYMPIGLRLSEMNLVGHMDNDFRFDLSGSFVAGEGRAQIISSGDYGDSDETGLRFQIEGDNLTLINVPDVVIIVNSDIDVSLGKDVLTINGNLLIPSARITPTDISATKVNESEDVVIVAGELPDAPEEVRTGNGLQFAGELDVSLGESVIVDLDLARASVKGGVKFNWMGDAIPMANGRYDIVGSVQAFGQVLDITEGAVRFPNVPANNPFIRVTAEREIFGNTQVKRAGVRVDGQARRPTVEAFTVPLTTEERAMTLLVTGSDFDYEQGVGAIDFGTYIAPRLFISYGVGVFERENVISARYDIIKGFGIKASSGSKESGVDLSYRFEN